MFVENFIFTLERQRRKPLNYYFFIFKEGYSLVYLHPPANAWVAKPNTKNNPSFIILSKKEKEKVVIANKNIKNRCY